MSPREEWALLLAAVQMLTRVPVPAALTAGHGPETVRRAVRYMPLVGLGVGGVAAGVCTAARTGLPAGVAAVLAVAASVLLCGALHEDGLADCCDGTGGRTREDVLRIMRDSRIGAYGVLGLVLVVAARVGSVAALAEPGWALVAAGACSRFWAVLPPAVLPYARAGGTGAAVAGPMRGDLVVAGLVGLGAPLLLLGPRGVAAVALSGLGALAVGWWARRRVGGYTGDVLGAVQQVAEVAVLLAALWRPGWYPV